MLRFPIMVLAITFVFASAGCVGKSPIPPPGDAVKSGKSNTSERMGGGGGKSTQRMGGGAGKSGAATP
jgi:hypothetical protein